MNDILSMNTSLTEAIPDFFSAKPERPQQVIGVVRGEGIGNEVIEASLEVLDTVSIVMGRQFSIKSGGDIGLLSYEKNGRYLSDSVIQFFDEIFSLGGAVLCGPGGGRFVYDLRSHFDLYCKLTPLIPLKCLKDSSIIKSSRLNNIDIIAVRENISGLYFGKWGRELNDKGLEMAFHHIHYSTYEIDRILTVALRLAKMRRKKICISVKPNGIPSISDLWIERAHEIIDSDIELKILEVDNTAYQLIAKPQEFDVLVSPNMFGDILADCGSLLIGSRGLSYSGNFGINNKAVYQTGHGAAYDLADTDTANPIGQMMSLMMMLRESFKWQEGASAIEKAIIKTLKLGYRTPDIAANGSKVVGTKMFGQMVCEQLRNIDF